MAENNEKKRFGRRAGFGIAGMVLITTAFYFCIFKELDLNWFVKYSIYTLALIGFIISGLSLTDVIGKKS